MTNPSVSQLKEALQIKEQIEKLEARLNQILGGSAPKAVTTSAKAGRKKFSPATIAKMRAAQQARWSKPGKAPAKAVSAPKKRGLSPEGRAKLAASMKARWAARKKNAGTPMVKAAPAKAAPVARKKPALTPEGRAKLAAMMKARWAARKKGAPAPNAAKK